MVRASYRDSRFTRRRGGDGVSVDQDLTLDQDLTVRGAPRMASLLHDMVTVRGIERPKDQILRRISMGRVGKR